MEMIPPTAITTPASERTITSNRTSEHLVSGQCPKANCVEIKIERDVLKKKLSRASVFKKKLRHANVIILFLQLGFITLMFAVVVLLLKLKLQKIAYENLSNFFGTY